MHDVLASHRDQLLGVDAAFDRDGLRAVGRRSDPAMAEKRSHALEYVGQLSRLDISFVFTGGTATQLVLPQDVSRLSKDVDVIAPSSDAEQWRAAVGQIARLFGNEVYGASEEKRTHGGLAISATH